MEKKLDAAGWKSVCDLILSTKGEYHPVFGRFYQDETVRIYEHPISGGGYTVERVENSNPVLVLVKDNTEFLRYHGEFMYVETHLRSLATLFQ